MGLSGLQAMWKERGLPGKILDITPDIMSDELLLDTNLDSYYWIPAVNNLKTYALGICWKREILTNWRGH